MSKRVANKKGGGGARSRRTHRVHVANVREGIDRNVGDVLSMAQRSSRYTAAARAEQLKQNRWQEKTLWQRTKEFFRRGVR